MDEISVIRAHSSSDKVYDNLSKYYSKYIPMDIDRLFNSLANELNKFMQGEEALSEIKYLLSEIKDIDIFDISYETILLDFGESYDNNIRLSLLIPRIIRIRKDLYRIAYYLSSDIIEDKIPDYHVHELFHLAYYIVRDNPICNFYADLTTYLNGDNVDRFYNEMELLDAVSNILEGKYVSYVDVFNMQFTLDKSHKKEIDYILNRFIEKPKELEKSDNYDNNKIE